MGNTVIWYQPEGGTKMTRIDLGCRITGRGGPDPRYKQTIQESLDGAQSSVLYSGLSQIQLRHTWQRDASGVGDRLRRQLVALVAHLQRGGWCLYTEDEDFAWAGFLTELPGARTIQTGPQLTIALNLFRELADPDPAEDRELWIQSDHDQYLIEHVLCDEQDHKTFALAEELELDYSSARWVLLREYGTWPGLRMPAEHRDSSGFVTHDRERIFRLDLPLEEAPGLLESMYRSGEPYPGVGPGPVGSPVPETPPYGQTYRWR